MTSAITGRVKPRIEIAPGGEPAGDPSEYVWIDAGKRRQKADIVITAGRDDEAAEVEAGSLETTMDNRDGRLLPRNILGPYYGTIGRGTPLRCVLDRTNDDFARSVSGSWGTNADGYAWTQSNGSGTYGVDGSQATVALPINNITRMILTGAGSLDAEIVWSTTLDTLPTGASFVSAALLRHQDSGNYVRAHLEFTPGGEIQVGGQRVVDGSTQTVFNLVDTGIVYEEGTKVWGKARIDGPYLMVKAWLGDRDDEPNEWHAAGTETRVQGAAAGLFLWRINTNAGTFTAGIDDFEIVNILWTGNIPEWSPKWPDRSGRDSTLPFAGAGILRRLAQGASPLNSPLYSQLSAQNPWTYVPLEDPSGTQLASSVTGRGSVSINGTISYGADDTLNGSATTAVLENTTTSQVRVNIASSPTPDGFSVLWFIKLDSIPLSDQQLISLTCTGTMTRWALFANNAGFTWTAYDRDNNVIASTITNTYTVDPTEWVAMQLETNVSGGSTEVALLWHQVGDDIFYFSSDTYTGTSSKPDSFGIAAVTDNMSVAHLWFGDNDLPFVDTTFMLVADGYRGEEAADRIARLCAENAVPSYVLDGDSEPLGRQRPMKLIDLLREAEVADQGTLCERGNALMYIPRTRRYNPPVSMALDWSLGHLDEAPEPTDDDQRFRNLWQVSRVNGATVTAADAESISSAGTYDDSIELNIDRDSRLPDYASWFLSRDLADPLRWPRIKINLVAHPELIPSWMACRIGSRVTVANPPYAQLAGEVIDVIIEGYTETINNYTWTVEMSCSPAEPWIVGVYDDDDYLYNTPATTLSALSETGRLVAIEAGSRLGFYSSDDVPYDVKIAGQVNRVIGCSLPDSVAIADGTFETYNGVTGWVADGATSSLPVLTSLGGGHYGPLGVTVTTSGSPSQTTLRNAVAFATPASPGQVFATSMWVKCSVARNVTATIDWVNSSNARFASSAATVAVAADTWTKITASGTAPSGTAKVQYGPTLASNPANGTMLTVDDIDIMRIDAPNSRQFVALERGVDGFTKVCPAGSSFRIADAARYAL